MWMYQIINAHSERILTHCLLLGLPWHRHMLKSYLESHFYRLQIGNNLSRFESKIRGGKENLHAISRPRSR